MLNLLAENIVRVDIGTAALYALIGFAVVFVGIAFLVLVVWGIGKLFKTFDKPGAKKKEKALDEMPVVESVSESVDEETVAVITAAIAAYYQKQATPCDFIVKKIKRSKI